MKYHLLISTLSSSFLHRRPKRVLYIKKTDPISKRIIYNYYVQRPAPEPEPVKEASGLGGALGSLGAIPGLGGLGSLGGSATKTKETTQQLNGNFLSSPIQNPGFDGGNFQSNIDSSISKSQLAGKDPIFEHNFSGFG